MKICRKKVIMNIARMALKNQLLKNLIKTSTNLTMVRIKQRMTHQLMRMKKKKIPKFLPLLVVIR